LKFGTHLRMNAVHQCFKFHADRMKNVCATFF